MTNELKEKILDCLQKNTNITTDLYGVKYYVIKDDAITELLAIIDEGIEKANVDFKVIIDNLIELSESGYYGTKNRQNLLLMLYSLSGSKLNNLK